VGASMMLEWRIVVGWMAAFAFLSCCGIGLLAWVFGVWCLIRLPFNATPTPDPRMVRLNPFNVALYPDLLTDRGLTIRRHMMAALLIFVLAVISGAAIGLLIKLLRFI
jgi:hypothetical protein